MLKRLSTALMTVLWWCQNTPNEIRSFLWASFETQQQKQALSQESAIQTDKSGEESCRVFVLNLEIRALTLIFPSGAQIKGKHCWHFQDPKSGNASQPQTIHADALSPACHCDLGKETEQSGIQPNGSCSNFYSGLWSLWLEDHILILLCQPGGRQSTCDQSGQVLLDQHSSCASAAGLGSLSSVKTAQMGMIQSLLFFFMDNFTVVTVFLFLLILSASPETAQIFKFLHMSGRWTELLQLQAQCFPDKAQSVQRQHRGVSRASISPVGTKGGSKTRAGGGNCCLLLASAALLESSVNLHTLTCAAS